MIRPAQHHIALIAAGTLLSLIGCDSRQTGEQAKLVFAYTSFDDTTNFNKPIALGATLELRVTEVSNDEEISIQQATLPPGILEIDGHTQNLVAVRALKPGSAKLSISGKTKDGDPIADAVTLRAAPIAKIELGHTCTEESGAIYQAGLNAIEIPMTKRAENGEFLTGYGVYPVVIEPARGATIDKRSTDAHSITLDLSKAPGRFSLKSTLNKKSLDFELILPAQINGLKLSEFDLTTRTTINQTTWLEFEPTYNAKPICLVNTPIEAKSLTPEICDITTILDHHQREDGSHALNTEGIIKVRGKRFGVCRYEAWLPEASAAARYKGSLEVGQYPSDLEKKEQPATLDLIDSEDPLARKLHTIQATKKPAPAPRWWLAPLLALLAPLLTAPLWLKTIKRFKR